MVRCQVRAWWVGDHIGNPRRNDRSPLVRGSLMPKRLLHPVRNWRIMSQEDKQQISNLLLVIIPVMALVVSAITIFLATFTQPLRAEAPFVFSSPAYAPLHNKLDYCPGETLEWPVAFDIRRAPVMVISVRSIWDVENNQTVTLQGPSAVGALSFTNYTETTHVSRTSQLVLPDLKPGQYQIRTAAQEFNSQAAAYQVPFRIKQGCPALPESK